MTFDNLDEALRKIESVCSSGMNEMADEMKDILKHELMHQIYADHEPKMYDRTGQLENTPQISEIGFNYAEVELKDNGNWRSVKKPREHFFPLEGWEGDYAKRKYSSVWQSFSNGRPNYYPKTTIMKDSYERCQKEIPEKLKDYLRQQGLDIV